MGKKLRTLWGGAIGATLQYLYDPQSGKSRRARLRDQAAAQVRRLTRLIGRKLRYQKGRLRGVAHELSENWQMDEDHPDNDRLVMPGMRDSGTSRFH